jgi:tRNA G26 N,N-dimethylase Trm1
MQRVLRDLGQHTPIKHLDWSAETWIWIQQNQDIVAELLKESTLEYFKYICKGLNEPDDVIYDSLGYMPHSLSHVIKKYYLPLDLEPIYIKEDVAFISNGTTGLRTWQASLLMLEYLTENVQLIKGKSILEIGAGCGLIGIAAKKLGAAAVVMTDVAELVIERIHDNIALNPSITSVNSVKYLDWQEPIY